MNDVIANQLLHKYVGFFSFFPLFSSASVLSAGPSRLITASAVPGTVVGRIC
jgi:hypothetical protein